MNRTIDRKLKFSVKYLSYAKKSGCMRFISRDEGATGKLKTLDKNIKDKEVIQYLFETSNWFLFEKDHRYLHMIDMFSE